MPLVSYAHSVAQVCGPLTARCGIEPSFGLPRIGFRCRWRRQSRSQLRLLQQTVSVASSNVILLQVFACKLDCDSSPASVWIRGWIVGHRIEMCQIVTDRGEGARLVLPALRKVCFAPGRLAHPFKDGGRDRFILCNLSADHVNDCSRGLGQ